MASTIDPYKELTFNKDQTVKFSTSNPFVPQYVTENLTLSSDPTGMYASRVRGRNMLLENPARESRAKKKLVQKRARRLKEKERKSRNVLKKKLVLERGVWKLDKRVAKFDLFLPLHHMWMGYMSELLGLNQPPSNSSTSQLAIPMARDIPSAANMHPKLLKADFHGSVLRVCRSKNPSLIGLSGIVIHETENAFRVVTPKDQVKLLPKQNAVFCFAVPLYSTLPSSHSPGSSFPLPHIDPNVTEQKLKTVLDLPHIEFELYGNQFRFRAADRAGRKFKHKETIEL